MEQNKNKTIKTIYNGCEFRSRLEARWAVFFDTLGISWEYRKERYINGETRCYYPDFYLPGEEVFIEVKPTYHTDRKERLKAVANFVHGTTRKVIVLPELPGYKKLKHSCFITWYPVFYYNTLKQRTEKTIIMLDLRFTSCKGERAFYWIGETAINYCSEIIDQNGDFVSDWIFDFEQPFILDQDICGGLIEHNGNISDFGFIDHRMVEAYEKAHTVKFGKEEKDWIDTFLKN